MKEQCGIVLHAIARRDIEEARRGQTEVFRSSARTAEYTDLMTSIGDIALAGSVSFLPTLQRLSVLKIALHREKQLVERSAMLSALSFHQGPEEGMAAALAALGAADDPVLCEAASDQWTRLFGPSRDGEPWDVLSAEPLEMAVEAAMRSAAWDWACLKHLSQSSVGVSAEILLAAWDSPLLGLVCDLERLSARFNLSENDIRSVEAEWDPTPAVASEIVGSARNEVHEIASRRE